jgi:hypothetical protein
LKSLRWHATSLEELLHTLKSRMLLKLAKVAKKRSSVLVNRALAAHLRKKVNQSPTLTVVNRSKPVTLKTSPKVRCQPHTGLIRLSGDTMAAKLEAEIDPIKYGAMYQKVEDLDQKMDKIETQVESLVSFADKAKGMAILASILIPIVTALATLLVNKMWG